ncbi:hypothetical protein BB561_005853 [Smittium simulii]|uniref:peptidylprolyl isomerase n=1 Tax=Smittium simulii TaxID=133385 RepID=A0A2T9Y821_9FUNG|nr:hypothetical protein BB561_005853 [Smittium simulii]
MSTNQQKRNKTDAALSTVSTDTESSASQATQPLPKRSKVSQTLQFFLNKLPASTTYEKSYMHKAPLTSVLVTKTDFLITASFDGHIKFWKKSESDILFLKNYKAHAEKVLQIATNYQDLFLASISPDKSCKIFDILNFDMINIINLDFIPLAVCWVYISDISDSILLISDSNSNLIYKFSTDGKLLGYISSIHSNPTSIIIYNHKADIIISADTNGAIEYWSLSALKDLSKISSVYFNFKTETDLYTFQKAKSIPFSFNFSPNYAFFATTASDGIIRVFDFFTGKIISSYNESLTNTHLVDGIDEMEFGRKLAIERELIRSDFIKTSNVIFDDSSSFIIYSSVLGIKIKHIFNSSVSRLIGLTEPHRFINIALWQQPSSLKSRTVDTSASDNPLIKASSNNPTIFTTAFNQNRFYLFTNNEPSQTSDLDRDIFNEKPSIQEQKLAVSSNQYSLASKCILRTSKGDIHIELYPNIVPKTVENFCGLSSKGYYDGVIFHRVIKDFMIQTGDPLGDGTGGESIWGHEFADEFSSSLNHQNPFTLSMANAGPNTNGSQFFITTVPAPWLDNKHTVFGRVTQGIDVVLTIEKSKSDKNDKPYDDISIINVELLFDN